MDAARLLLRFVEEQQDSTSKASAAANLRPVGRGVDEQAGEVEAGLRDGQQAVQQRGAALLGMVVHVKGHVVHPLLRRRLRVGLVIV